MFIGFDPFEVAVDYARQTMQIMTVCFVGPKLGEVFGLPWQVGCLIAGIIFGFAITVIFSVCARLGKTAGAVVAGADDDDDDDQGGGTPAPVPVPVNTDDTPKAA